MDKPTVIVMSFVALLAAVGGAILLSPKPANGPETVPPQVGQPAPVEEAPPMEGRLMPPAEPGLLLYTDTKHDFLLYYPEEVTPLTDRKEMTTLGYIPVCDPDRAEVCFPYGKEKYVGTNFEGAAFAVLIYPELKGEAACRTAQNGEQAAGETEINGTSFARFTFGDAAMSHRVEGETYRAFHEGACLGLSKRIASSVFEVHEPGSIKEFTDNDRVDVQIVLDRMLKSFRFQGNLEVL